MSAVIFPLHADFSTSVKAISKALFTLDFPVQVTCSDGRTATEREFERE
jgi:hypothetical protein